MNVRNTVAVDPHRINIRGDLQRFMKERAARDRWGFRHLARLGILPERSYLVETTERRLTATDKEGSGLAELAAPTQEAAIYVLAVQQQGATRVIAVDNRSRFTEPAMAQSAEEIADAILNAFPEAKGKVVLAPGGANETYSFMGNGRTLTDMAIHGIGNVVAIPEDLGGGFVAVSTRDGQRNELWYLTAKKARDGHFSVGSWKAVAQFEAPVVGIGVRLFGTNLVLTMEGLGLRIVDVRTIANQTVREVGQSETPRTIRALGPIAEADGPLMTGLFTDVGSGGQTRTYFGRLDPNGLPVNAREFAAIA